MEQTTQQINGISVKLDAVLQRLDRLDRRMDDHERYHRDEERRLAEQVQENEHRLTKLESQVQARTWIGTVGIVGSVIAGFFGIRTQA